MDSAVVCRVNNWQRLQAPVPGELLSSRCHRGLAQPVLNSSANATAGVNAAVSAKLVALNLRRQIRGH